MRQFRINPSGQPNRGFTLIEAVIVILMLGIAGAAMVMLQGSVFSQRELTRDQQIGAQLQQECAERFVVIRRTQGFNHALLQTGTYSQCADLPVFGSPLVGGNFALQVTITSRVGGAPPNPCPAGRNCKLITIGVSKSGGLQLKPISFQVTDS